MIAINGQIPKGIAINGQRVNGMANNGEVIYRRPYALTSSGGQWIDLGLPFAGNMSYRVKVLSLVNSSNGVIGSRASASSQVNFVNISNTSSSRPPNTDTLRWGYGTSATLYQHPVETNVWYDIYSKRNTLYIDGELRYTTSANSTGYPGTALLFGYRNSEEISGITNPKKIEFCQVWDGTDELVRDLVPVPQGSTWYSATPAPSNCMWDKVTRQYFENQGTGTFGIEVALSATPRLKPGA